MNRPLLKKGLIVGEEVKPKEMYWSELALALCY